MEICGDCRTLNVGPPPKFQKLNSLSKLTISLCVSLSVFVCLSVCLYTNRERHSECDIEWVSEWVSERVLRIALCYVREYNMALYMEADQ